MLTELSKNFSESDLCTQSNKNDTSPGKWHLAHTSWFYESFILKEYCSSFKEFNPSYHFLFNSYYNSMGAYLKRTERGDISSPCLKEILEYREFIDTHMINCIGSIDEIKLEPLKLLLDIGINHEQQHQELFLMDIKHALAREAIVEPWVQGEVKLSPKIIETFIKFPDGLISIGEDYSSEFCFDNETPRHKVYVHRFSLSNKLVTNGEYLEFLTSKSYNDSQLWLSDGFEAVPKHPLFWRKIENTWYESSPYGLKELELDSPLMHISFFEADAYACFRSCRLPTEAEWEMVANTIEMDGQFLDSGYSMPFSGNKSGPFYDYFGSLWQWTKSSYETYPMYKRPNGSLGEYNAKFTNGLRVLRGGCFQTPKNHFRKTYRNFYAPSKQWPFTGIRLAKDIE